MTTLQAASAVRPTTRRPASGGLWTAFRSSRKALAGLVIFLVITLVAVFPSWFTDVTDPMATGRFDPRLQPSGDHWLGTTSLGQDIWAQLVYGAREPLIIALVAGFFATLLSVVVGVSAAYLGGVADDILSMLTNVVLVIPTFPLIIILAAYAGNGSLTVMLAVLVATGWSYGANQLRIQALSLRNRDFLESARVRGERRSYIILFEVLPTMTSLIVAAFLNAALYSVLNAAGLQFLGLGDQNTVSWGTMLHWAEAQSALDTGLVWWAIAPGLAIALLGAAFALMNYAFDEISNPALRPVRKQRVKRLAARRTASAAVAAQTGGE
jgi:peptide/nickel transport system permease protein